MSHTLAGTRPHRIEGSDPEAARRAVHAALVELRTSVPGLLGALVASVDGLPIAADMHGTDPAGVAAMAATAAGLGKRIVDDFQFGDFAESVVRASGGYFVVYSAGRRAVLAAMASEDVNLGRVHLEARRCAATIANALARSAR